MKISKGTRYLERYEWRAYQLLINGPMEAKQIYKYNPPGKNVSELEFITAITKTKIQLSQQKIRKTGLYSREGGIDNGKRMAERTVENITKPQRNKPEKKFEYMTKENTCGMVDETTA